MVSWGSLKEKEKEKGTVDLPEQPPHVLQVVVIEEPDRGIFVILLKGNWQERTRERRKRENELLEKLTKMGKEQRKKERLQKNEERS